MEYTPNMPDKRPPKYTLKGLVVVVSLCIFWLRRLTSLEMLFFYSSRSATWELFFLFVLIGINNWVYTTYVVTILFSQAGWIFDIGPTGATAVGSSSTEMILRSMWSTAGDDEFDFFFSLLVHTFRLRCFGCHVGVPLGARAPKPILLPTLFPRRDCVVA